MLNDYKLRFQKLRELNANKTSERFIKPIEELKKGSFIKIYGELFLIEDEYQYKASGDVWKEFQLFEIKTGNIKYLEVEKDDVISLCLTTKEIKRRNFPVSMDDVENMSEEEEGEIRLEGITYFYEDDYKAKFSRNGSDRKEEVYLYEFESDNREYLTIEEWQESNGEYSYEIFLSKDLNLSAIEVLAI